MNDVTERERAQQELARTATQHAEIIESLDEALLLLDPDGRILSRNGRVGELLGEHCAAATTLADLLAPLTVRDTQGRPWADAARTSARCWAAPPAPRSRSCTSSGPTDGTCGCTAARRPPTTTAS